ncbi:PHP domain-containing protein [Cohnella sp. GCM10027633]|uniref:PHP domain-containing protein n=1 Tax=unclassified Cohnella TaxID=2636738 RepID=UPI0036336C04
MNDRADLHTHTTASDGTNRPAHNVRLAAEAGLGAIAITDHDTVAGIAEALAAGREAGVLVVPGVEISTVAGGKDIHILGYGIDYEDGMFIGRLLSLRDTRNRRNELILARLAELGMPIALEEVEAVAGKSSTGGGSVGRPHIAQALVDRGFVSDIRDAFDRLLADGKPAHVNPPRIDPLTAIRWIHDAGGTAVVAHPGLYGADELVAEWLDGGADGIEAYHSDHDEEAERRYVRMAEERGKLITGGSDYHGLREGVFFHGPIGNRTVALSVAERLLGRRGGESGAGTRAELSER